jgi:hypothetical protein
MNSGFAQLNGGNNLAPGTMGAFYNNMQNENYNEYSYSIHGSN